MNVKLLRRVAKHVLDMPTRLLMNQWVQRKGDDSFETEVSYGFDGEETRPFPPCGTVACIAGWSCELKAARPRAVTNQQKYARKLLGLTSQEAARLFLPDQWPDKFEAGLRDDGEQHTAEVAAARIEHFIKTKGKE